MLSRCVTIVYEKYRVVQNAVSKQTHTIPECQAKAIKKFNFKSFRSNINPCLDLFPEAMQRQTDLTAIKWKKYLINLRCWRLSVWLHRRLDFFQ